jgi:hypothetical protein
MRIRGSHHTERREFWQNSRQWVQSRQGLYQFLLAVAVGFALAAVAGAVYKLGAWKFIEPPLRAMWDEAQGTAKTALETNELPTLYFDIGFEEFQIMARQRDEALEKGILLLDDDDWQRAQIRYLDETIPIRIRLKGDWTDHLDENKWSFRVKTRGDAVFMGMRSFSVQSPRTRNYMDEWLYLEDLRRADILAPRYAFINVHVNGDDWGVYALEESFAKELLESQGRREGVIVRYDESLFWRRRSLYGGIDEHWKLSVDQIAAAFEQPTFAQVDEFNTIEVQSNPVLKEQSATALGLLRGVQTWQLPIGEAFDTELMGRFLAHTNLWGARHTLEWHNGRFYYNPLTSRLEPIGYDALPLEPAYANFTSLASYNDLEIMAAYAQEVTRISQPAYLQELQAAYTDEFKKYYAALVQEFDPYYLQAPWDALAERQAMLVSSLHPPQTVYAYQVNAGTGATLDLQVSNLLYYPVTLQKIQIGDQAVDLQTAWVEESDAGLLYWEPAPTVVLKQLWESYPIPKHVTLHIPSMVIQELLPDGTTLYSHTLQIVTNLYSVEDQVVVDVRRDYPALLSAPVTPAQPSVEQALEQHPFLSPSEQAGFLELRAGDWQVQGDLVLPDGYGLWATQAVSLTFERDAILFANGPLLLQGPAQSQIYLGPQHDYWAGLIVLQADPDLPSMLQNVEIRATAGIARQGWITTGGVTFYESPLILRDSRLLGSVAEDAINVVRTRFEFMHSEFGDSASDAFDGDFVQGKIEHCAFHDVRGDGIDVSGSTIAIQDVNLLRIYDKGVSAGEASVVTVNNVHATDIGMAIASKDTSQVSIQKLYVSRAWVAGLAAFMKKMEYGSATINATHVVFQDQSLPALVQTGSSVVIDGQAAATGELDVDELYVRLAALAAMQNLAYQFGPAIQLVGYDALPPRLAPGEELRLALYWQASAKPEQDYSIFVHILDAEGKWVAQQDNMPQNDTFPTTRWSVGPLIDDARLISLPSDLPPGQYQVALGMYLWQTGERLPVYLADGSQAPDGIIVLDQTFTVDN